MRVMVFRVKAPRPGLAKDDVEGTNDVRLSSVVLSEDDERTFPGHVDPDPVAD
jgi:hypothetical protein